MEYLYPECASCYFHNHEPTICEMCDGASEYSPSDSGENSNFRSKTKKKKGVVAVMKFSATAITINAAQLKATHEPQN